jgi:hypothetical protein
MLLFELQFGFGFWFGLLLLLELVWLSILHGACML